MNGHTDLGTLLDSYRTSLDAKERHELSGAPAVPLLAEGAHAGDWTVGGFLARGGSSEIYCARHRTVGTSAVLKVLWRTEARSRERFRREVRFLMENPGPSFPAFYGSGETAGHPWMALEPLDEFPLPYADASVARYLLDVAAGVSALHAKGWLHRDIKPGNILRRADGHAVLVDFGLLKKIGDGDTPGSGDSPPLSVVDGRSVGVGTPGYAAPEQFGGGPATPALDVYALGMLANRCFGGSPPPPWRRIVLRATAPLCMRYPDVTRLMRAIRRRHWSTRLLLAAALTAFVALAHAASLLLRPVPPPPQEPPPEPPSAPEESPAEPPPVLEESPAEPPQPLAPPVVAPVVAPPAPPVDVPGLTEISDWFAARDEAIEEVFAVISAHGQLNRAQHRLDRGDWEGASSSANRGLEVLDALPQP